MRRLEWPTPFASLHPFALGVSRVCVDEDGWIVDLVELALSEGSHRALAKPSHDKPEGKGPLRRWHLTFSDVAGVKVSNESYFDWTAWRDAMEDSHPFTAFMVEGAAWRDEFWNGRQYNPPMVHFAISTGDTHVEVLAAYCDIVETVAT
jgi:hypothetical protein